MEKITLDPQVKLRPSSFPLFPVSLEADLKANLFSQKAALIHLARLSAAVPNQVSCERLPGQPVRLVRKRRKSITPSKQPR